MGEILQELNEAFQLISNIPVTGEAVDSMALARAKLRKVYADLKKIESEGIAEQSE